jgi:hypothetical protein
MLMLLALIRSRKSNIPKSMIMVIVTIHIMVTRTMIHKKMEKTNR